ncbi:zinc finger, CCHC-type containing protein [Tanacetum coccineum]
MDESISVSSIIDKLPPSWKDFKHTLKHNKDELSLVQLGKSHFRIKTIRAEESGKGKGKEIAGSSLVNMIEDGKNKNNKKNSKGKKRKNNGNNDGTMVETLLVQDKDLRILIHHKDDAFAWWIESGATYHACKDRRCSKDVDSSMWHVRLEHVHYKRMLAMSKDNLIPKFDITFEKCNTCMLTKITRQPFKDIKQDSNVLELIHSDLCDFHATPSLGNKNIEVDPRTFDKAMQSRDVALWKEAINNEMDLIMENNS